MQLPARVHPDLAAGALGQRRRLAAVVDVGVGDHDQLDVADPVARAASACSRWPSSRGRACPCPRARSRRRPAVPRRCSAGRRAGRAADAAATRRAAPARRGRRPAFGSACARPDATVQADGEEGPPPERIRAPESEYRDEHGSRARAARRADPRDARAVRRGRGREHPLPRGRVAARGRVPVRAPRGALGDRGDRADHAPEGTARPLPLRLGRRARAGFAACCASTSPSTSPTWRHRDERRRLRAVADRLLPRGEPGPAGAGSSTTLAAPLLLALQREMLERDAWPLLGVTLPGQYEGFWRAARDAQLDAFPSAELAEAGRSTRRCGSRPPRTRTRWPPWTRRGSRAPRAPGRRCASCALPAPLGDHAVADRRRRAAGRDGHARVRGLRHARAVPRPRRPRRRLGRAARVPGGADRPARAGARDPHPGAGTDLRLDVDGPHLDQLRRQAQHAVAARSSPGRTSAPPRA